jgi:hypothetical protein
VGGLDDPYARIHGVDEDARYFVFFFSIGGRHNEPRANLELLCFHKACKLPNSRRSAVTDLTRVPPSYRPRACYGLLEINEPCAASEANAKVVEASQTLGQSFEVAREVRRVA